MKAYHNRKIIVTDDNAEMNLKASNLSAQSFSFEFADERENNIILGNILMKWILEKGSWIDDNVYIDTGMWLDN